MRQHFLAFIYNTAEAYPAVLVRSHGLTFQTWKVTFFHVISIQFSISRLEIKHTLDIIDIFSAKKLDLRLGIENFRKINCFHVSSKRRWENTRLFRVPFGTELTNTAYPGSNFSFIFDAVNQFSSEKEAHTMWWIPEKETEQGHNLLHILK